MEHGILKRGIFIRNRRAQSTLEMLTVIISIVLLFGGMLNIWLWANKQIVMRKLRYNATRQEAGTAYDYGEYNARWPWPLQRPEELREDKALLKVRKP